MCPLHPLHTPHPLTLTPGRRYHLACWGYSESGQTTVPAGYVDATALVCAGQDHTCAVNTIGELACWGANGNGQTTVPAQFSLGVTAIACGYGFSCAVLSNGNMGCWGGGITAVPGGLTTGMASVAAGDG